MISLTLKKCLPAGLVHLKHYLPVMNSPARSRAGANHVQPCNLCMRNAQHPTNGLWNMSLSRKPPPFTPKALRFWNHITSPLVLFLALVSINVLNLYHVFKSNQKKIKQMCIGIKKTLWNHKLVLFYVLQVYLLEQQWASLTIRKAS